MFNSKRRIIDIDGGGITVQQIGMLVIGIIIAIVLIQSLIPLIVAVLVWSLAGWGAGKIVQGHGYDPVTNILYGFGGGLVSYIVLRILGIDLGNIFIVSDVLEGMVGALMIIGARNLLSGRQTA